MRGSLIETLVQMAEFMSAGLAAVLVNGHDISPFLLH
jgi:hypothetical protein